MSTNGHGNHHQNGRFSSTNDTMVGEFDDVEIDHYDDIIEENSQMYIFSPLLKLSQSLFQNDIFMLASDSWVDQLMSKFQSKHLQSMSFVILHWSHFILRISLKDIAEKIYPTFRLFKLLFSTFVVCFDKTVHGCQWIDASSATHHNKF